MPAEHVKVVVITDSEGERYIETPWALRLGPNLYELANLPFYAYGLSVCDHFAAEEVEGRQFPVLTRILKKSGNRTVRVIFDPPSDESEDAKRLLQDLVEMGCDFEGANPSYISINIPEEVDIDEVCRLLTARNPEWEHADPTWNDLYPNG